MLKKYRVLILFLVGLTLISLLAACSGQSVKKISTSKSQPSFKVIDDAGKTVKLDKKPTKIVSLSPGNTEILFALGLDKEIVGVTKFDDYPAKAKTKTKIGGFSTPNVEKIISLKPNLVVATGGIQAPISQRSEEHTSELQSHSFISYAVFCLKKKKKNSTHLNSSHIRLSRNVRMLLSTITH